MPGITRQNRLAEPELMDISLPPTKTGRSSNMNENKPTSAMERYARRTTEEIAPAVTETEELDKKEYQAFATISTNRLLS